jgi:DNA-binding CsgD family transcriptional regulator
MRKEEPRSRGRRSSLEQDARIQADAACAPDTFGYSAPGWTGELLSQHLRARHGVVLSARQGRRILRGLGIAPSPSRRNPLPVAGQTSSVMKPLIPAEAFPSSVGKARQQAAALQKIQRLASSGLPLHPFVLTLFDLMADAIPVGGTPSALFVDPELGTSWVFANLDESKWVPILMSKLTAGHGPQGFPIFRPQDQLVRTQQVLFSQEEFTFPGYKRSDLYNEFLQPLKCEQGLLLQLMSQHELVGYYPLYRDANMKPFDQDDRRFLKAVAPHIAHGLRTAKLVKALTDCLPSETTRQAPGIVVMRSDGRVLGLDARARSIFFQVGMYDGVRWSAFAEPQLRSILAYVARRLAEVFDNYGLPSADIAPPVVRILSHPAGIALRLTGHSILGEAGEGVVVVVEQIEPEVFRRARLMYRHGLGPREAEVLVQVRRGFAVSQIAIELGISTSTAKTYIRNLIDKLGVPDLSTLRAGNSALA